MSENKKPQDKQVGEAALNQTVDFAEYDLNVFRESTYDSVNTVRNSMPAPSNPNRDQGGGDKDSK